MNCLLGSGRKAPRVQIADEVGPGATRSPASPASAMSPVPSGRVTSSASAPSSTGTPAISDTDSFPPSRGDPSSRVTRTASSLRKNAAASPAIPPPTITTCGRALVGSMTLAWQRRPCVAYPARNPGAAGPVRDRDRSRGTGAGPAAVTTAC